MTTTTLPAQLSDAARAFASRDFGTAADGRTFETVDPSTGQVIATLPLGGQEEVDAAEAYAVYDRREALKIVLTT
jgi:acyl-CoA reductase-like NAD-dependent aldehyde dehydrogenase